MLHSTSWFLFCPGIFGCVSYNLVTVNSLFFYLRQLQVFKGRRRFDVRIIIRTVGSDSVAESSAWRNFLTVLFCYADLFISCRPTFTACIAPFWQINFTAAPISILMGHEYIGWIAIMTLQATTFQILFDNIFHTRSPSLQENDFQVLNTSVVEIFFTAILVPIG